MKNHLPKKIDCNCNVFGSGMPDAVLGDFKTCCVTVFEQSEGNTSITSLQQKNSSRMIAKKWLFAHFLQAHNIRCKVFDLETEENRSIGKDYADFDRYMDLPFSLLIRHMK